MRAQHTHNLIYRNPVMIDVTLATYEQDIIEASIEAAVMKKAA